MVRLLYVPILLLSAAGFAQTGNTQFDPFKQAWENIQLYDFEKAIPQFRSLQEQNKIGSPKWIEATFGLALSLHHKTPPAKEAIEEARKLYLLLGDKYSTVPCAARALMNAGRIDELRDYYQDKIDLDSARKLYRKVIEKYKNEPIVSEAVLRLAQSYTNTFKKEEILEGIKIMQDWLKDHPNDPLAGLMHLLMADMNYYPLLNYKQAVTDYIRADELKSLEPGQEGYAYWRIALLAQKKLNDKSIAVKYYTKIIKDTPTFVKGYQAQLALKELGAPVPPLLLGGSTTLNEKSPEVKK
jgi:tetratricopeptide (TPR) repeat protein